MWKALLYIRFFIQRLWHKAGYIAIIAAVIVIAALNTEIDFGICTNSQGDGIVYNADPEYNYISYRSTQAQAGDKVLSVFFLNPTNLAPDDYIYRADWICRRASR